MNQPQKSRSILILLIVAGTLGVLAPLLLFGGCLATACIGAAMSMNDDAMSLWQRSMQPASTSSTPTPRSSPTSNPESYAVVTASTLYSAYTANELAADQKYKGRMFVVSGEVESVGNDILGDTYVSLSVGEYLSSVQCMIKDKHRGHVANLSKGQSVQILGRCSGKSIMSVMMRDGEILSM